MNEDKIIITEFIEANCPYCRYVEYSILRELVARRDWLNRKLRQEGLYPLPILEIRLVDIDANIGNKDLQWFENYSEKLGGRYTPAIRVGETGKIFYMWGKERGDVPTKKEMSAATKLKSDIINEIQAILSRVDKSPRYYDEHLFNQKRQVREPVVRPMYYPYGGFLVR